MSEQLELRQIIQRARCYRSPRLFEQSLPTGPLCFFQDRIHLRDYLQLSADFQMAISICGATAE
jgi:hypothetical protein